MGPAEQAWKRQEKVVDAAELALKRNQDALAEQQAALETQREGLLAYEEAIVRANDSLDRQREVIEPLRSEPGLLEVAEARARAKLEAQDRAIDPLRENREKLNLAEAEAARIYEDQRKKLVPLTRREEELNDLLALRQQQYAAADKLIEPRREQEEALNLALVERNRLHRENSEQILDPLNTRIAEHEARITGVKEAEDRWRNETIAPLLRDLEEQQRAQDLANEEFERQDALLDPLREKQELLNDAIATARDNYERAYQEGVELLNERLEHLEGVADNASRALDDQEKKLKPYTDAVTAARDRVGELRLALEKQRGMTLTPLYNQLDETKRRMDLITKAYDDATTAIGNFRRAAAGGTTTTTDPTTQRNQGNPYNRPPPPSGYKYGPDGRLVREYAAGVTDFTGGLAYVHRDELLVNMPRGTDVLNALQQQSLLSRLPASAMRQGGPSSVVYQFGDIVVTEPVQDGYTLARQVYPALQSMIDQENRRRRGTP